MDNITLVNGFIFVKKAEPKKDGKVEYAQAIDDFIFRGEVVKTSAPHLLLSLTADDARAIVGKVVYFRKDAGEELKLGNQTLKAIKSEDIICYE